MLRLGLTYSEQKGSDIYQGLSVYCILGKVQRNYKIKAITLFHNIIVLHIDSKNTSFYKKSVVGSKGQILVVKY